MDDDNNIPIDPRDFSNILLVWQCVNNRLRNGATVRVLAPTPFLAQRLQKRYRCERTDSDSDVYTVLGHATEKINE